MNGSRLARRIVATTLLAAAPAAAQVTTDTGALNGLAPTTHPHHAPPAHAASHHHTGTVRHAQRTGPVRHATNATSQRTAAIPAPRMPLHPPPPPIIAPPALHVPLHPPSPPPPVPVDPHATGTAATASTASGSVTTLTFGPDGAGLNAAMMAAVQDATRAVLADPDRIALIDSHAPGTADDPSSPRRLSLRRALAVRAIMINGGVPSTRIFARALGAPAAGIDAATANSTAIAVRDQRLAGAFAPVATP